MQIDFHTIAGAATLLYETEDFFNDHRRFSYYPSMNFTCFGHITKLFFVSSEFPMTRGNLQGFATQNVAELILIFNQSTNISTLSDRLTNAQITNVTVMVNRSTINYFYKLYEVTFSKVSFNTNDVFILWHFPWSNLNPLHQVGGGMNVYGWIPINWEQYSRPIQGSSLAKDSFLPLVAIEAGKKSLAVCIYKCLL